MENIAIIMGGDSDEKYISLKSGNTIYKHIDRTKYNPYKILCLNKTNFQVLIKSKNIKINNKDFSFLLQKKKISFKKVFMMIHGNPGENGELCDYFESKNIAYTSCGQKISMLTFNKFQCNNYLKKLGYKTPYSEIFHQNYKFNFPCIVKPTCSGSSFGIRKVYNDSELKSAVKNAKKHDNKVLLEEFVEGREVTCAIFNSSNEIKTLPITEIITENDIFDYDAKYNGKSVEQTPAKIDKSIEEQIKNTSKKIYKDLTLKGVVRIDFIINGKTPYIIEINTIPGFSEESIVPKMLKCADIELKQFITSQIKSLSI